MSRIPIVAVILGYMFANEHISLLQIAGLTVILLGVLLINFTSFRDAQTTPARP